MGLGGPERRPARGRAVKQEIKAIGEAMTRGDMEASPPPEDDPPSFNASRKQRSRKASRIDDYSTFRASRFAAWDEAG